jgi:Tol biopolymer transport system component
VLDPVYVPGGVNGNSEIFVSHGGALLTSRGRTNSKLAWIGKTGSVDYISNEVQAFGAPRLSPDQQSIAVTVTDQGKSAIWIYDLGNKTFTRLSTTESPAAPVWSPDGKRLYYVGLDDRQLFGAWVQNADGSDAPQKLLTTRGPTSGLSISPDGKSLLAVVYMANSWNVYSIDLLNPRQLQPYAAGQGNESAPKFSPDGRWVALVNDDSGRNEVFIRSWPNPTVRLQVSAGGGSEPTWSPDGSAVFYRTGATLIAARLTAPPSVRVRARDTVLTTMGGSLSGNLTAAYDLARDGRVIARVNSTDDYQLIAVPNWRKELEQKLARANRK